jgi:hypothetical protein
MSEQEEQRMNINEDLLCLDSIERILDKVKHNYNPHCPFCGKVQLLTEDN